MKALSSRLFGLTSLLFLSMSSFANQNGTIQSYNRSFNFDWNSYATIAPNQARIASTEEFISTIHDYKELSIADRQALGSLLYKLGTYYTHIAREPDKAINKLTLANSLLTDKQAEAWDYNHLAYAYELKFATTGNVADKNKALNCTDLVINKLYQNKNNKEVAFAHCVAGLIYNDSHNYKVAEQNFQDALHIYEQIPGGTDNQYYRAKNRLADIILDQGGRDKEALAMLIAIKKYWFTQTNTNQDPYVARNLISLGQAYLKLQHAQAARGEFVHALNIYKNVYGANSRMLAKPYRLIAQAYKSIGNIQQASLYSERASLLRQS